MSNRIEQVEESTLELEDKALELTQSDRDKEKKKKKKRLQNIWDYLKQSNLRMIGVLEEEEKSKSLENIFEGIIEENFPALLKI